MWNIWYQNCHQGKTHSQVYTSASFTFPRSLFFFFCPRCKESSGLSKTVSTKIFGNSETVWQQYEELWSSLISVNLYILELINNQHVREIHVVLTSCARVEVELMTVTSALVDALSLSSTAKSLNPDMLNSAPSSCCSALRVIGGCNVGAFVV